MSCKQHYVLHNFYEKLLCTCYDMVKGNRRFDFEKEEVRVKCECDFKKSFVPTQKECATEAARRQRVETKSTKK